MIILNKSLTILFYVIIFTALPFAVFTLATSKFTIAGIKSFVVVSGSMQPTLPVGSVIYSRKQPEYLKGQIISFDSSTSQIITHRIINVQQNGNQMKFQTKGDANNAADTELVPSTSVIGQEFFAIPYLGYGINFLRTPIGFVLGVVVPILIFIGFEVMNIKREIEKETEKRILRKMEMQKSVV